MRIAKRNLKKQTQFPKGQNDVKSVSIMVYGDFDGPGRRKNKANQSQCRDDLMSRLGKIPQFEVSY